MKIGCYGKVRKKKLEYMRSSLFMYLIKLVLNHALTLYNAFAPLVNIKYRFSERLCGCYGNITKVSNHAFIFYLTLS